MPRSVVKAADLVHELLALIRAEGLAAGDRLPSIRQLSVRLGARPHSVRDALLQAQVLGHVKVHPRSRAVVQSPGLASNGDDFESSLQRPLEEASHHLFHMLEARELVENEIVRQAARKRRLEDLLPARNALRGMQRLRAPHRRAEYIEQDIRFHLAIAAIAANPVLTSMLTSLLKSLRSFLCQLTMDTACLERAHQSHVEIYQALVAGDADRAREQMHRHLKLAYDTLLGELRSVPA